jgi:hypothetical protein
MTGFLLPPEAILFDLRILEESKDFDFLVMWELEAVLVFVWNCVVSSGVTVTFGEVEVVSAIVCEHWMGSICGETVSIEAWTVSTFIGNVSIRIWLVLIWV